MIARVKKFKSIPRHWDDSGHMKSLMGKIIEVEKHQQTDRYGAYPYCSIDPSHNGGIGWYFKASDLIILKKKPKDKPRQVFHPDCETVGALKMALSGYDDNLALLSPVKVMIMNCTKTKPYRMVIRHRRDFGR